MPGLFGSPLRVPVRDNVIDTLQLESGAAHGGVRFTRPSSRNEAVALQTH